MVDSEFLNEQGISLTSKNIMHEYFTIAAVALVNGDHEKFEEYVTRLQGYTDRDQFAAYLGEYAEPLVNVLIKINETIATIG